MSKTNSTSDLDRATVLKTLIEGTRPASEAQNLLGRFNFDSDPLVTLRASHICHILTRYLNGQATAHDVALWADVIEVRDDIDFDPQNEPAIKEAIHQLANPVLSGALDEQLANRLLSSLEGMNI